MVARGPGAASGGVTVRRHTPRGSTGRRKGSPSTVVSTPSVSITTAWFSLKVCIVFTSWVDIVRVGAVALPRVVVEVGLSI